MRTTTRFSSGGPSAVEHLCDSGPGDTPYSECHRTTTPHDHRSLAIDGGTQSVFLICHLSFQVAATRMPLAAVLAKRRPDWWVSSLGPRFVQDRPVPCNGLGDSRAVAAFS